MPPPVRNLRWWIGGLLFASTVINYIDRQTLSVLAPFLKTEHGWSNSDFATIVIAFRIAYAAGQTIAGRLLDRLGTRLGLTLGVLWYSLASMLTPFASGLRGFWLFRFLLGAGEAANWPAATKAVSEWFPDRERGWAVALFDSGSAIGAAVAPFLVLAVLHSTGSWRAAFVVPGLLGLIWLWFWRRYYFSPEQHSRLSAGEREMILAGRPPSSPNAVQESWGGLLRRKNTWGIILGKALTDPVWFFVTDWFAVYLVSKGISVEEGILTFWIPFVAADAGNFLGGGISSFLIRRGWNVLQARKAVIVVCGFGMAALAPSVFVSSKFALALLFGISTCAYAAWSTMALALPADLFPTRSVASVSGMSGTGAGIGTIVSTFLVGWAADHYSFAPVLVVASIVPLIATALVLLLVHEEADA